VEDESLASSQLRTIRVPPIVEKQLDRTFGVDRQRVNLNAVRHGAWSAKNPKLVKFNGVKSKLTFDGGDARRIRIQGCRRTVAAAASGTAWRCPWQSGCIHCSAPWSRKAAVACLHAERPAPDTPPAPTKCPSSRLDWRKSLTKAEVRIFGEHFINAKFQRLFALKFNSIQFCFAFLHAYIQEARHAGTSNNLI